MSDDTERVRVALWIHGRVQGVWFRASTRDEAARLGLVGWARNEPDGTVRALAEGTRGQCEALIRWCHEGPPLAQVTRVDATWGEATGEFRSFGVSYG